MGRNILISLISCGNTVGQRLTSAVRDGDVGLLQQMLDDNPKLLNTCLFYERQTLLHVAVAHGQLEVLSMLLERGAHPNTLNRCGQTALMLASKTGQWTCIEPLLKAGASILGFDLRYGRTCLHYACRGDHTDCVRKILDASRRGPLSQSWGLARFVNLRDGRGQTALHIAAKMGHASVLRLLLDNGALVSTTATTIGNGPGLGSSPIHFAARGGSLDCVRELLAWGADRNQRDLTGYTPFGIAMQHSNTACAAILNPHAAEPLVWPSPWKFMSEAELEPEAKTVLQAALAQANIELDKEIAIRASQEEARRCKLRKANALNPISEQRSTPTANNLQEADTAGAPATLSVDEARIAVVGDLANETATEEVRISKVGDLPRGEDLATAGPETVDMGAIGVQDVCCICFEQFCTIEVMECGHQMCATCTLSLCCHSKPNPAKPYSPPPACPFCRHSIGRLILARPKPKHSETSEKKSKRRLRRSGSKNSRGGSGGFGSFTGSILGITLGGSKRHGISGRVSDAALERSGSRKHGCSGRASDASLERSGSRKQGGSVRASDASLERSGSRKQGGSGRVSDAAVERCVSNRHGGPGSASDAAVERCGSKRHGGSGRLSEAGIERSGSKLGASGKFVDAILERCGNKKLGASGRVADADWLDRCGSKSSGASGRVADADWIERCGSKRLGASGRVADADWLELCGSKRLGASGRGQGADWLEPGGNKRIGTPSFTAEIDMIETF